jgi:sterol desaturase/sphingolipid hydroxylase (fatty acid hydroxylase superfamily)
LTTKCGLAIVVAVGVKQRCFTFRFDREGQQAVLYQWREIMILDYQNDKQPQRPVRHKQPTPLWQKITLALCLLMVVVVWVWTMVETRQREAKLLEEQKAEAFQQQTRQILKQLKAPGYRD